MKFVFYDIESTGLTAKDEPIQFGAIVTDGMLKPVCAHSFYCYTQVPIAKGAYSVHKIDHKSLYDLSAGKTFEDQFFELPFINDDDITWCSYSSGGFDERLINQALTHNGLNKFQFGTKVRSLDSIGHGRYIFDVFAALQVRKSDGHRKQLVQYVRDTGITDEQFEVLFKKIGIDSAGYHDALFDAFALWFVVFKNKELLGFGV